MHRVRIGVVSELELIVDIHVNTVLQKRALRSVSVLDVAGVGDVHDDISLTIFHVIKFYLKIRRDGLLLVRVHAQDQPNKRAFDKRDGIIIVLQLRIEAVLHVPLLRDSANKNRYLDAIR